MSRPLAIVVIAHRNVSVLFQVHRRFRRSLNRDLKMIVPKAWYDRSHTWLVARRSHHNNNAVMQFCNLRFPGRVYVIILD